MKSGVIDGKVMQQVLSSLNQLMAAQSQQPSRLPSGQPVSRTAPQSQRNSHSGVSSKPTRSVARQLLADPPAEQPAPQPQPQPQQQMVAVPPAPTAPAAPACGSQADGQEIVRRLLVQVATAKQESDLRGEQLAQAVHENAQLRQMFDESQARLEQLEGVANHCVKLSDGFKAELIGALKANRVLEEQRDKLQHQLASMVRAARRALVALLSPCSFSLPTGCPCGAGSAVGWPSAGYASARRPQVTPPSLTLSPCLPPSLS